MKYEEIFRRLTPLFRDVLDNPGLALTDESSRLNTPAWDSLAHINIIAAVQDEFHVQFSLGELEHLGTVGEMAQLVEAKIGHRS
jgi:acyl carrier protein